MLHIDPVEHKLKKLRLQILILSIKPTLWNKQPHSIRSALSMNLFKEPKAHLFPFLLCFIFGEHFGHPKLFSICSKNKSNLAWPVHLFSIRNVLFHSDGMTVLLNIVEFHLISSHHHLFNIHTKKDEHRGRRLNSLQRVHQKCWYLRAYYVTFLSLSRNLIACGCCLSLRAPLSKGRH